MAPNDDSFAFGDMQAFNIFLTSTVHIAFAHAFRPGRYADGDEAAAAMRAKVPQSLGEYFGLIEEKLSDGRPWVHGDAYTVSDPYLLVFSRWFTREGMGDWSRFERVTAHRERMNARPAVQRTLEAEGLPVI